MIARVSIPFEAGLEDHHHLVELVVEFDHDNDTIYGAELYVGSARQTRSFAVPVPALRLLVPEWDLLLERLHDAHDEAVLCGEVA